VIYQANLGDALLAFAASDPESLGASAEGLAVDPGLLGSIAARLTAPDGRKEAVLRKSAQRLAVLAGSSVITITPKPAATFDAGVSSSADGSAGAMGLGLGSAGSAMRGVLGSAGATSVASVGSAAPQSGLPRPPGTGSTPFLVRLTVPAAYARQIAAPAAAVAAAVAADDLASTTDQQLPGHGLGSATDVGGSGAARGASAGSAGGGAANSAGGGGAGGGAGGGSGALSAVASRRLARDHSSTLRAWMALHWDLPFPDTATKNGLCTLTTMSQRQVEDFFARERKRVWRPLRRLASHAAAAALAARGAAGVAQAELEVDVVGVAASADSIRTGQAGRVSTGSPHQQQHQHQQHQHQQQQQAKPKTRLLLLPPPLQSRRGCAWWRTHSGP